MHSSSPVRTPELQLAAEPHRQENVGSHQGKISHTQGQRRSPSKMVGGPKSHLESNPIPARDAQRAQTYLVHTRTQRPQRE